MVDVTLTNTFPKKNESGDYDFVTEPLPVPSEGEVLIRCEYSSMNPYDWYLVNV